MRPLIAVLLMTCGCSHHSEIDKSKARSAETLLEFYKECLASGNYDMSYFVFDSDFQSIVPRVAYNNIVGRLYQYREFIETLVVTNIKTTDDSGILTLASDRFGLSFAVRLRKSPYGKTWLFAISGDEYKALIDKFWKWYLLQLQSADYQRYAYPRDWHYKELR